MNKDKLWRYKDINGKPKWGIIPIALAFVFLSIIVTYLSLKGSGGLRTPTANKNQKVESSLSSSLSALKNFGDIPTEQTTPDDLTSSKRPTVKETTTERTSRPKQSVNLVDKTGFNLAELNANEMMEVKPTLVDDTSTLDAYFKQTQFIDKLPQNVKVETGDDGRSYLKGRGGIFSAVADPGTLLKTESNVQYSIGKDGLLYRDVSADKRELVSIAPKELLYDLEGRAYKVNVGNELQLVTPGGPGKFKGPDQQTYEVRAKGVLATLSASGEARLAESIGGNGEFLGTDGQVYIAVDGNLFKKVKKDVSFGRTIVTGLGMFTDPAGNRLFLGEDGRIYKQTADNKSIPANIEGEGQFVGPDGGIYRKDKEGQIIRLTQSIAGRRVTPKEPTTGTNTKRDTTSTDIPVRRSGRLQGESVNVTTFLPPSPEGNAKVRITGGNIFKAAPPKVETSQVDAVTGKVMSVDEQADKYLLPTAQRIPFFLLTEVTTEFESNGIVEAQIAENVFAYETHIPAGSKLLGVFNGVGKKNRMSIEFTAILFPNKKELPISAIVYDVNRRFGLEAYYEPAPPWVIAGRFANAFAINEIKKRQPTDATGEQVGDVQPITDALEKTQNDLEERYGAYHVLPRGTVGIAVLTNSVDIRTASYSGLSNQRATKAEALKTAAERKAEAESNLGGIGNGTPRVITTPEYIPAPASTVPLTEPDTSDGDDVDDDTAQALVNSFLNNGPKGGN